MNASMETLFDRIKIKKKAKEEFIDFVPFYSSVVQCDLNFIDITIDGWIYYLCNKKCELNLLQNSNGNFIRTFQQFYFNVVYFLAIPSHATHLRQQQKINSFIILVQMPQNHAIYIIIIFPRVSVTTQSK